MFDASLFMDGNECDTVIEAAQLSQGETFDGADRAAWPKRNSASVQQRAAIRPEGEWCTPKFRHRAPRGWRCTTKEDPREGPDENWIGQLWAARTSP